MKKNLFVFMLLLNALTASSFTCRHLNATRPTRESFKRDYPGALYVKWESVNDSNIYSVRFVHNNKSLVAYYNEEGVSIGYAQVVGFTKLPEKVRAAVIRMYQDFEIINVQELILQDNHSFYLDILGNGNRLFICLDIDGKIRRIDNRTTKRHRR